MSERIELLVTRGGNAYIGNFYRVSAYRGAIDLGARIWAGYTRRESVRLAREIIRERGRLD